MGKSIEIKICGLCHPSDAAEAARAGADYVGVILAPGGPRSRSLREAAEILDAASPAANGAVGSEPMGATSTDSGGAPAGRRRPRRVGIFVDAVADEVIAVARELRLDVVQLHGTEPPEVVAAVRAAGIPVWKAVRVRDRAALLRGLETYADLVDAIHLDSWSPQAPGGTGIRFGWSEVADLRRRVRPPLRLVLAGGLTPETVPDAVRALEPDVVDVSSGVESSPGVKDAARMVAFIDAARSAAASLEERALRPEGTRAKEHG